MTQTPGLEMTIQDRPCTFPVVARVIMLVPVKLGPFPENAGMISAMPIPRVNDVVFFMLAVEKAVADNRLMPMHHNDLVEIMKNEKSVEKEP